MQKPANIFGRDRQWRVLERFLFKGQETTKLRLGIVSGRRRIGKTHLLAAACQAVGGIYFMCARDEGDRATRARFAEAINARAGTLQTSNISEPPEWADLLRAALKVETQTSGPGTPALVVIDEYPYALSKAPQLSGLIQLIYDEAQFWQGPGGNLILCGSALSIMNHLLEGDKPLRGRAQLDMRLRPLDFRETAKLWNINDPNLARLVHATVGGIPGYLNLVEDVPATVNDFDRWVVDNLLSPDDNTYTQFEMDYLLREDPRITNLANFNDVLSAVSSGATTVAKIAAKVGRNADTVRHPIGILESAGYLSRTKDLLGRRKPEIVTTDPIIRFDRLITAPNISQLELGQADQVWARASRTFAAQILGPHFEELAREWVLRFAPDELGRSEGFGDVGNANLHDHSGRAKHEIDVLALHDKRITFLGEAKATLDRRGLADLERLDSLVDLLTKFGYDTTSAKLGVFSLSGFNDDLERAAAQRTDVELVSLERLYGVA